MRLFTAIDLEQSALDELDQIMHGLPGAKWVKPENLHLTLTFIGDVSEQKESQLIEELAEASIGIEPFSIRLKGVGQFLRKAVSEVLWVGVEDSPELLELQKQTERAIRKCGFKTDSRKYQPHITIARLKNTTPARVEHYLNEFSDFELPKPVFVNEFILFESELKPGGAVHTEKQVFELD